MNFKELRDRVLAMPINDDVKDALERVARNLDSAIDDIRDAYNNLESAISDFDNDDLETLQRDLDREDESSDKEDPIADKAYTWRIAAALLMTNGYDEIELVKTDNPDVFWAALSVALSNYPPYRVGHLNQWILRTFPV